MASQIDVPVITIAPSRGWAPLQTGELWQARELLYFLVWRDVKVRYKHLAKMPSDGIPYPIFTFATLVPWTPIAYPSSLLSEPWPTIQPMTDTPIISTLLIAIPGNTSSPRCAEIP